jgi:hypothetical protein
MSGRILGTGLAVLAVLGLPAPARAAEDVGVELGARVGYGLPLGKASDEGDDLSELISGQVPLWLDLGVRANRLFVGGYFQYGIGMLGDAIDEDCEDMEEAAEARSGLSAGCRVRDVRLGVQLHYHFGKPREADPWLGFGAGYEWVTTTAWAEDNDEEVSLDTTGRGFELLNLQGGVDFLLGSSAALGPFFTWTVSQFDKASISCSGECGDLEDQEIDIDDKSLHHWFIIGARFSLFP